MYSCYSCSVTWQFCILFTAAQCGKGTALFICILFQVHSHTRKCMVGIYAFLQVQGHVMTQYVCVLFQVYRLVIASISMSQPQPKSQEGKYLDFVFLDAQIDGWRNVCISQNISALLLKLLAEL